MKHNYLLTVGTILSLVTGVITTDVSAQTSQVDINVKRVSYEKLNNTQKTDIVKNHINGQLVEKSNGEVVSDYILVYPSKGCEFSPKKKSNVLPKIGDGLRYAAIIGTGLVVMGILMFKNRHTKKLMIILVAASSVGVAATATAFADSPNF